MTAPGSRHVAILGGSAGIGLATARVAAARGARVTLGGRDQARLDTAAQQVPGAATVVTDAEDGDALAAFFAAAGPIDDLVVTVTRRGGGGRAGQLAEADLLGGFAGKTVPQLRAVGLALPTLAERGSITLVGGVTAQAALPGTAVAAAVNGATEAAVPPLARELAPRRVNAVSPGVVETGWWDALGDARQPALTAMAERTPLGRNAHPDEVGAAILALIENPFITGVVLPVDGGLRLT
jgi:NAD(P)-dependent dehydrogenase (short-subunit alcohol dehydrogenase family)